MNWWNSPRRVQYRANSKNRPFRLPRMPIRLERLEDRWLPAPVPTLSGLAPLGSTQMLLGDTVRYNFNFTNASLSDVGYSPFLEIAMDTSGPDGATSLPRDGFGTPTVTVAGLQMVPVGTVTLVNGQTTFVNPFTGENRPVPAGFGAADTIFIYQLPFGSFTPGQTTAVFIEASTSNLADVNTPLPISIVPGFRDTDAVAPFSPVYGSQFNTDATPVLYRLRKTYLGPENETATGPNFVRRYRIELDIATGQTLTDLQVTDTLAASMQIIGKDTTVVAGSPNMAAYLYATAGNPGANLFNPINLTGTAVTTSPGGTLIYNFGTKTGVSGVDAAFEFNFYVPRDNASPPGGQVLPQNSTTGTDSTFATNSADSQAQWNPLDTRDPQNQTVTPAASGSVFTHTLEQQSIAVQKSVTAIDPTTGQVTTSIRPGQTLLQYTIQFQVSDYYAFDDVFLRDVLSDGQRLFIGTRGVINAFPTMSVNNAYLIGSPTGSRTNTSGVFQGSGVIEYQRRYTAGDPDSDPTSFPADGPYLGTINPTVFTNLSAVPNTNLITGGTTFLQFNISAELKARLGANAGRLVGGEIGNDGTGPFNNPFGSQLFLSGTQGTIVFFAEVSEEFSDALPSGDRSVDQGDVLSNSVNDPDTLQRDGIVGSQLLPSTINDLTPTGIGTGTDDSGASVSISYGLLSKQIHAINGVVVPVQSANDPPLKIQAGDRITYRLTYTLPISSFEQLRFVEFPPLPVLNVANNAPFSFIRNPAAYGFLAGEIGVLDEAGNNPTDDTYFSTFDPTQTGVRNPTLSIDATNNTLIIDFGTNDDLGNRRSTQISVLVTFAVSNDPFVEDLFLTNQLRVLEDSTNAGETTTEALRRFELVRPFVNIYKGAVAGNATGLSQGSITFAPATNPTGTLTIGGSPLSSSNALYDSTQAISIGSLNITPSNAPVDAGDVVRYAIVVQNSGAGDAFDVRIADQIQSGLIIPATFAELNLRVFRGDGTPLVLGTDYLLVSYDNVTGEFVLDLVDNYTAGNVGGAEEDARPGALSRGESASGAITNGSNTVLILYDLTLAANVPANSLITNTATVLSYSNNEGGPDVTDPQVVPGAEDPTETANIQTIRPGLVKQLTGTEITEVGNNATNQATIGELVTYTLTLTVPEGEMTNARIVDTLQSGLAFVRLVSVTISSANVSTTNSFGVLPSQTPTNVTFSDSGRIITFDFGTITNTDTDNTVAETITLVYETVVLNVSANQANATRTNSARISWTDNLTTVAAVSADPVTIVEPTLTTSKQVRNLTNSEVSYASSTSGDAGDLIEYRIVITNGNAASDTTAFDVTLSDVLPALLTSPTIHSVTSTGGIRINGVPGTVTVGDLQLSGNTLSILSNIDMPRNSTITILVRGTFTGASGLTVPNTAQVRWTSMDGEVTDRSVQNTNSDERTGSGGVNDYLVQSTANLETPPLVYKSLVATSETHTSGSSVAVGEIVRYRLVTTIGEGTTNNFQIQDTLPSGLSFLNDGTARYAFVSTGGTALNSVGITNVTGLGTAGGIDGDQTTIASLLSSVIVGQFNDDNIATAAIGAGTGEASVYNSGQSVFFRFGNIVNSDNDTDNEYIVVEFNALVANITTNQAGTNRDNTFTVLADTNGNGFPGYLSVVVDTNGNGIRDGSETATTATDTDNNVTTTPNTPANSNSVRVTIAEPSLSVNKQVVTTTGSVVTYRVTVSNASGVNISNAYDTRVVDTLDGTNLSLILASVSAVTFTGGANGSTNNSAGQTVDLTITDMPPGSTASFTYQVDVLTTTTGTTTLNNTVNLTYTSLSGGSGTGGAWTGVLATSSTVPGTSGTATGERDGSNGVGGLNDYVATDTERLGSLGDRVWVDLNNNGVQNSGESGIVGAPVTVRWAGPNGTFGDADDSVIVTTTGADGLYVVSGLPIDSPGAYRVTVDTTAAVFVNNNLTTQTYDADGLGTPNQSQVSLTSATPNPRTQDFGYRGPGTIGDRIFLDINNNGSYDPGEGIANVTVQLTGDFDGDGFSESVTTTTDTDGFYQFSGLRVTDAGVSYSVTVLTNTLPPGVTNTVDPDGGFDSTSTTTLTTASPSDQSQDFGYRGTGSIGDRIFLDINNNGVPDAGEGIAGVTVQLTGDFDNDGQNETVTTTTDTNGYYQFSGLVTDNGSGADKSYTVTVVAGTLPNGLTQTVDPDSVLNNQSVSTISTAAPSDQTRDFGYRGPGSIGDRIFLDINNNGSYDAGEGIANVTVQLTGDFDGDGISESVTTTTDTDGFYQFSGLRVTDAGVSYTVTVLTNTLPERVINTVDPNGGFDSTSTTTLTTARPSDQSQDFGYQGTADPFGYVYIDHNGNGRRDPGEPGIPNVEITISGTVFAGSPFERPLTAADVPGGNLTIRTDANGFWQFNPIPPGTYTITQRQPTSYVDGLEENGDSNPNDVTVDNDVFSDLVLRQFDVRGPFNFGEILPQSSLSGSVYIDRNNNGRRDPGEPGIPGVTILLRGTDSGGQPVSASVVTDAQGNYIFRRMAPGTYTLIQRQPWQYIDGLDRAGSRGGTTGNDIIQSIVLTTDEPGVAYLFGERSVKRGLVSKRAFLAHGGAVVLGRPGSGQTVVTQIGNVSGTVYVDANRNGRFDAGEQGLLGVEIRLVGVTTTGRKIERTTRTNADGSYLFADLPVGTYSLFQTQPQTQSYRDGRTQAGNLAGKAGINRITDFRITDGARGVNYNFGEFLASLDTEVPSELPQIDRPESLPTDTLLCDDNSIRDRIFTEMADESQGGEAEAAMLLGLTALPSLLVDRRRRQLQPLR